MTCLTALMAMPELGVPADNHSKGCGGVMRAAPVGLYAWAQRWSPAQTLATGTALAALTHGHRSGTLTAGVLAVLIQALCEGMTLPAALARAKPLLQAARYAASDLEPAQAVARLGEGWVAEEALAIAVYCALIAADLRAGVILAVNHDGDSDSTGAIAGNLLGALHGVQAIPAEWLTPLELRRVIDAVANDLYATRDGDKNDAGLRERYPVQA